MPDPAKSAIARAGRNAHQDWFLTAERAVRIIAREKQTLTSDDVWEWMRDMNVEVREPRAMGAVMKNAARDAVILPINQWECSRRPVAHRRPVRLWKSLII